MKTRETNCEQYRHIQKYNNYKGQKRRILVSTKQYLRLKKTFKEKKNTLVKQNSIWEEVAIIYPYPIITITYNIQNQAINKAHNIKRETLVIIIL